MTDCDYDSAIREMSLFNRMGTRAEDFWQEYETSFHNFVDVPKYSDQFLWGTKLFCLKKLCLKSSIKD